MHVRFRVGSTELMASDGDCEGQTSFHGFLLSISPANDAEAERLFNVLADGGEIQTALEKTFWASSFGLVTDRFGLSWMVSVANQAQSN
jgi:PhnB protein